MVSCGVLLGIGYGVDFSAFDKELLDATIDGIIVWGTAASKTIKSKISGLSKELFSCTLHHVQYALQKVQQERITHQYHISFIWSHAFCSCTW